MSFGYATQCVQQLYVVQEEVTVVGRITLDAESSSSGAVKLNEMSLALEASRDVSGGRRISLKFDPQLKIRGSAKGAGGLGFFPGAMVAFRGRNGSGAEGYFLVTEILVVC
jgi:DNA polymerase alpha subunit B